MKAAHERLFIPLNDIHESPENVKLYRPVTPDDPETIAMADSIRKLGVLEPIVISADDHPYIISGHKRCIATPHGLASSSVRALGPLPRSHRTLEARGHCPDERRAR